MNWLARIAAADALPAVWLMATPARPANLGERSQLRRSMGAEILAVQLGRPVAAIAIGHDAAGRPLAPGSGLHLSLAQRDGFVAVALARSEIGVDVERVDDVAEPPLALLHPAEAAWIGLAGEEAGAERFALIWAAKEAFVKALGTGFTRPPESFAVTIAADGTIAVGGTTEPRRAEGAARLHRTADGRLFAAAVVMLP